MKIGILGGTFDPVHIAHIEMAKAAKAQYCLDKVYLMPSANSPHKDNKMITDGVHRANMVKLAVENLDGIEFSDFEMTLDEVTYTATTLEKFKANHKSDELYFILGSDSIAAFFSWYQPEKVVSLATLLVAKRDDESSDIMCEKIKEIENRFNINIRVVSMNAYDISSSEIRLGDKKIIESLVPSKVYDYILEHGLYQDENINKAWNVNKIIKDLENILKPSRIKHTLGVAETAKEMAEFFKVNPNKAYLAGILHDCAKNLSEEELLDICKNNNIFITNSELKAPYLLHGKVGAFIAESKYGISDEEVLASIIWHTTGKPDMSNLEKIIFCADYIEPNRTIQPNLDYLRQLANKDLDLLTYNILKDTVKYLKTEKADSIDEMTISAYKYYKNLVKEK